MRASCDYIFRWKGKMLNSIRTPFSGGINRRCWMDGWDVKLAQWGGNTVPVLTWDYRKAARRFRIFLLFSKEANFTLLPTSLLEFPLETDSQISVCSQRSIKSWPNRDWIMGEKWLAHDDWISAAPQLSDGKNSPSITIRARCLLKEKKFIPHYLSAEPRNSLLSSLPF